MSLALVAIALLTSCSARIISTTTRQMEPETLPLVAELDVRSEKVEGSFTINDKKQLNGFFKLGKRLKGQVNEAVVQNAIYQALKSVKADVLVALQCEITEVIGAGGCVIEKTAVVSGYPAYYKNIRHYDPSKNKFDLKEMKDGVPYFITETDGEGHTTVFQVIIPEKDGVDLNKTDLDKLILTRDTEPEVTVEVETPSVAVTKSVVAPKADTKATKKAKAKKAKAAKKTKKARK